jgi:hypothetical protein
LLIALLAAESEAATQTVRQRSPTVLWAACEGAASMSSTDDRPVSLHEVALRARPALWFSRDEPLLDLDGPLPREWPRRNAADATPEDLVYYRITKVKSASSDDALVRAFHEQVAPEMRQWVSAARANPEAIAEVPLASNLVAQLKEVVIRYLFYYPNELGAHSHVHDLESVELRIVVEQADESGDPRAAITPCRQIRVATLYGAAHGLGLYTNVLDLDTVMRDRLDEASFVVEATSRRRPAAPRSGPPLLPVPPVPALDQRQPLSRTDPFWPLLVLVEEGKHASAPDRNGDGMFTPNYDVNQFAADAWGVRDTMRSRQLSPVFRSDTFKQRIPEIAVDDTGGLRYAQSNDAWAAQMFNRYVRYEYRLRRPTEDTEICGDRWREDEDRRASMKQYASDLLNQLGQGHPEQLLRGKAFCEDVAVHGAVNVTDVLGRIEFGGAYNGFTRWWERISASARFDGGTGWAATVPFGLQVPGLGGWTVVRLSQPFPGMTSRKSIDVAYMPSASRFSDWYVAAGLDYGRYVSNSEVEDGRRFSVETGIKFRFPLPDFGTFFGGRIGIRANGKQLERQRLVFEVGAGIW